MLKRSRHCVYVTLASSFLFRESFWKVCVPIEVFFEPTEKAGKDGKVKQGERKQRHLWINIQFLILGWFLFILGFLKYGRRLKENERNQQKEVNALLMQPFCFQTNPKVGTSKGSQSKSHFSFVSDSRIKKSRDVPSSLLRQPIPARDAAPASGPGESVFFLAGFESFFLTLLHIDNKFVRRTMMMTILQYGQLRRAKVFFNFTAMKEPWTL